MTSALFNLAATATILSKSELSELVAFYQSSQCNSTLRNAAMKRLIHSHIRMAHKVASKHKRHGVTHEDLLSCAVEGIITAAKKFDNTKNASFTTYARMWMVAKCQAYVQANSGILHCGSRTSKALWSGLQKARKVLGDDATHQQIADHLGLDAADVAACTGAMFSRGISIDAPISEDGGTVASIIPAQELPQDERMDRARNAATVQRAIADFAATLTERNAAIFTERVVPGLMGDDKRCATTFGITKQGVGQAEKKLTASFASHIRRTFGDEGAKNLMGF